MLDGLSHIMMYVTDFDRALRWYTETLGCRVLFSHAPHYAALQHDGAGISLALHPTEADGKDVGHGPIPYFVAKDIDATIVALKELGVRVGEPRSENGSPRFATFWDSEGNALGLQES